MRNLILIFLAVFLFIVVAGGSVLWLVQAAHTKAMIEEAVAEFNKGPAKIAYNAVEVSGFPFEMRAVIFEPRLTGRLDPLLPPLADGAAPWEEEFALGGNVTLIANLFSDRYEFAVTGNWKNKSNMGGRTFATEGKSGSDFFCTLRMKRGLSWLSSRLWNLQGIKKYGESFLQDFRNIDCTMPEHAVINQATGATLVHNGPGRFYINHDPKGDVRQIRFYLKSTDVEVSREGNDVLAAYARALAPSYPFPSQLSAYGKQNADIDISYSGPARWSSDLKLAPIHIRTDRFSISNQAYNANVALDLSSSTSENERAFLLNFKSEISCGEAYDALLKDMTRETIRRFYDRRMEAPAALRPLLDAHTPETLYALVEPAIPNFPSLGKMVLAADLNYRGNREFTAGEVAVKSLELSAVPYGISGQGALRRAPGALLPGGKLTFTCTNCLRLVDDGFDYLNRVRKVADAIQPGSVPAMEPRQAENLKTFLRALAGASADKGGDFTYHLISDDLAGPAINGKPLQEVMALYQQTTGRKPPANAKETPAQ